RNDVSKDKVVNIKVVNVTIPSPVNANHLPPYLSNNRPVIGDIIPITIAPGRSIRPDFSGVYSSTFCINNGSNVSAPINESITTIVMIIATLKIRKSEENTSELQSRFDIVCRLL